MTDVEVRNQVVTYERLAEDILKSCDGASLPKDMPIIALMGPMGSGKSTIADLLVENYGFRQYAFGDAVKYVSHKYFDCGNFDAYIEGKLEHKPRSLYQKVGQKLREFDQDIWVKTLEYKLAQHFSSTNIPVVIDDLRQPNERLWAFDKGIPVIRVYASKDIRIQRLENRGDIFEEEHLNHDTEKFLNILTYDYTIVNNGSIDDLKEQVNIAMHQLWKF